MAHYQGSDVPGDLCGGCHKTSRLVFKRKCTPFCLFIYCNYCICWPFSSLLLLSLLHVIIICLFLVIFGMFNPSVPKVTHDLDDRLQKECETEITILQMLEHPNLRLSSITGMFKHFFRWICTRCTLMHLRIKYHTHFTFHGDLYLVMELATGGTLANRIEQANQILSCMGTQSRLKGLL